MMDTEQFIFERIMQDHTKEIGLMIGEPFIKTQCTILSQELGITSSKLRQSKEPQNADNTTAAAGNIILQVGYMMNYTSRYGYDISRYPEYFLNYMDESAGKSLDFLLSKLDGAVYVQSVGDTAYAKNITADSTPAPINANLVGVNNVMVTAKPIATETTNPSSTISTPPSDAPSSMPSIRATEPVSTINPGAEGSSLLIGILVAFFIVATATLIAVSFKFYWQKRRWQEDTNHTDVNKEHRENESRMKQAAAMAVAQDQFSGGISPSIVGEKDSSGVDSSIYNEVNASVAIPIDQHDAEADTMITPETAKMTLQSSKMGVSAAEANSEISGVFASDQAQTQLVYPTIDSMISLGTADESQREQSSGVFVGANLMANDFDSSSSSSFEETLSSYVPIGDGDEFDKYRNQLLETLRIKIESSVDDIDGMMSLAITRIFMEPQVSPLDLSWIGGEDLGSIEASCLYEAFEWTRKNESFTGFQRRRFFEDMLNKIGRIVHHGLIRPHDGARILHGCASIVNMPLINEYENTTVGVYGLVKTNDVARGNHLLVETFGPFGDIVDASIAPQNKGFGFVRFVQSESVREVLKKQRTSEIEIEDVAVSIETL